MKPRTLLRLIVSLLLIAAFVIGATILESSNSLDPTAWLWAQRKLPLLWAVDGFAVLTLLPVLGFASQQNRLARKSEEMTRVRDEYQNQLQRMLHNIEQTDQINAGQSEEISNLQQTVTELNAKLTAMETEGAMRQRTLEAEARRLAEQAFAALSGQVEANTRQMEAVNLAMQYQRAEIKQLRQGIRAIQHPRDLFDIARLTPMERAALQGEDVPLLLEEGEADKETRRQGDEETEEGERGKETGNSAGTLLAAPNPNTAPDTELIHNPQSTIGNPQSETGNPEHPTPNTGRPLADKYPIPEQLNTPQPGFFEATMNADSTIVVPTMEYEVPLRFDETTNLEEASEDKNETPPLSFAPTEPAAAFSPPDTSVTEAEYRLLFDRVPPAAPEDSAEPVIAPEPQAPFNAKPRRWFLRF